MYLLDANVLITADNLFYGVEQVPEYWEWLRYVAESDLVKMPREIYDEVKVGPAGEGNLLYHWLADGGNRDAILLPGRVDPGAVQRVLDVGYGTNLTDVETPKIGQDAFLVAYALQAGHTVVTGEVTKPKRQRANRKVPDVCDTLGVRWCSPYQFNKELRFSTDWRARFGVTG